MDGLLMKYFVLKPAGNNVYAEAFRKAMRAYANHIGQANNVLAIELRQWAHKEAVSVIDQRFEKTPRQSKDEQ